MTLTDPSDIHHPHPAGLTDADHARIAAAHAAARTASTRAVCAYLAERAAHGITIATLNVACSAIGHTHRSHGVALAAPDAVLFVTPEYNRSIPGALEERY